MNNKNLVSLKERTAKERKLIASKGGIASAKKRQEEKEKSEQAKNLLELLTISNLDLKEVIGRNLDLGLLSIYNKSKMEKSTYFNAYDLLLSLGLQAILYNDKDLQNERLKATRMLYDMKQDSERKEERKQERQFRHTIELKELELKERALELEERKVKAKEELIAMKNRGAIDVNFTALKKEPKLLEAYIKKQQQLNKKINKELQEELIQA